MRFTVMVIVVLAPVSAGAKCFSNAQEVWREEPHAHASWRYVNGERCWHAGWSHTHHRKLPAYGMVDATPLPVPRPLLEHVTPEQGHALADELLPATFEERWPNTFEGRWP